MERLRRPQKRVWARRDSCDESLKLMRRVLKVRAYEAVAGEAWPKYRVRWGEWKVGER